MVGLVIAEMGAILFLVIINSWLGQFYEEKGYDIDEVKDFSAEMTALGMGIATVVGVIIGVLTDRTSILPYIVTTYLFRAVSILLMVTVIYDIEKQKGLLYFLYSVLTITSICQSIVIQGLLHKKMIGPIKEITNGVSQIMRGLGVMIVTGAGAIMSQNSVDGPYILVAICDLLFVLFVLTLWLLGKTKSI
jgi:hypothetical protein